MGILDLLGRKPKVVSIEDIENDKQARRYLSSVIPASAYPQDASSKEKCQFSEVTLLGVWKYIVRTGSKSFERPSRRGLPDPFAEMFASAKEIFLGYLSICHKSKATAPAHFMRAVTQLCPQSGLAWYCLLLALGQCESAETNRDEIATCLSKATELGCDYVKPDGKGGMTLSPLY